MRFEFVVFLFSSGCFGKISGEYASLQLWADEYFCEMKNENRDFSLFQVNSDIRSYLTS